MVKINHFTNKKILAHKKLYDIASIKGKIKHIKPRHRCPRGANMLP
jgi:hypothetical protein